jgi:hypothetical protein
MHSNRRGVFAPAGETTAQPSCFRSAIRPVVRVAGNETGQMMLFDTRRSGPRELFRRRCIHQRRVPTPHAVESARDVRWIGRVDDAVERTDGTNSPARTRQIDFIAVTVVPAGSTTSAGAACSRRPSADRPARNQYNTHVGVSSRFALPSGLWPARGPARPPTDSPGSFPWRRDVPDR